MDCLHAAEILSAALDGETVSPGSVAHAREHAARCPECAALLATMDRVSTAPQFRAPEHLVARIIDAARAEADARADAEAVAAQTAPTTGVIGPLESARPRPRVAPRWWQPHFTPLASAAAVVLVVSAVSTYVLVQMTGPSTEMMTADSTEIIIADENSTGIEERELAATPDSEAASLYAGSAQSAPSYVVWDGGVWVRADGAAPDEPSLSSAGTAGSDLGEPGGAQSREVLTSAADPSAIFVRATDDSLIRFAQVTRTLGGRTYSLVADTELTSFGTWPSLPSRFPTPTAADGSPGFAPGGIDDLGREVFVPVGANASDGFALAPGTSPGDPAAGNPNWTWWEPVD